MRVPTHHIQGAGLTSVPIMIVKYYFLDTQRCISTTINPSSPEFPHNLRFDGFTHHDEQSKPKYAMVLMGVQDDQKERGVGKMLAKISEKVNKEIEQIRLVGGNTQDSDDTDSDFSALNSQPSTLNHSIYDSQYSEDNQAVTPIDVGETEANYQWEVENDIVVTGVPVECEDVN